MYIDTHVHLNSDVLYEKLDYYLNKALEADVQNLIIIGFDHTTNQRAIEIAEKYPFVYASVGFHPTEAKDVSNEDLASLDSLLKHEKVVAVGECGLDFYWDKEHIDKQIEVFEAQIIKSKQFDKPLSIHMRDASEKMYEVLKKHAPLKGIMHYFSGSKEMAEKFLSLGLHISLGGPVTFKNAKTPKDVAKIVPIERLLIETDAPYLAPHPYRGKQNDSSLLPLIAEAIAEIKNLTLEEVAKHTTKNAKELFGI